MLQVVFSLPSSCAAELLTAQTCTVFCRLTILLSRKYLCMCVLVFAPAQCKDAGCRNEDLSLKKVSDMDPYHTHRLTLEQCSFSHCPRKKYPHSKAPCRLSLPLAAPCQPTCVLLACMLHAKELVFSPTCHFHPQSPSWVRCPTEINGLPEDLPAGSCLFLPSFKLCDTKMAQLGYRDDSSKQYILLRTKQVAWLISTLCSASL